jgi:subtilisin family serine protease
VDPLSLVGLSPLMNRTAGSADVAIGLIDGPVALDHPALTRGRVREVRRDHHLHLQSQADVDAPEGEHDGAAKTGGRPAACLHGTFVAGILCALRGSAAPAICPDCTLLVRPIFTGVTDPVPDIPTALPAELADAIRECVDEGARVLNISAALAPPFLNSDAALEHALTYAARRGVIVIAAAGNARALAGTALTRHPCVIPVVSFDLRGLPMDYSNLGHSIGRRGLGAPGDRITSLGGDGKPLTLGGTSAAAPFVTGAIALLWSEFPRATAGEVKHVVTQAYVRRRPSIVPPLLDAWAAHQALRR